MPDQSSAKSIPNVLAERTEGKDTAGSPPRRPFLMLFATITIPIVILDQVTKVFVRAHMALYESIALIPNYLDITYTLNPGAAFSMLDSAPPWFRRAFLLAIPCVAITVLAVLIVRSERWSLTSVAFALILGGATGNFIDRAFRGGLVIDFMRAHYYDLNYPIFNVADSAISIGVSIILLTAFFGGSGEPGPDSSS